MEEPEQRVVLQTEQPYQTQKEFLALVEPAVPSDVVIYSELYFVNLAQSGLNYLPPNATLFSVTYLTTLNLTGNNLEGIPSAIGKLIYLRELVLNKNMLQHLPRQIGSCSKLEKLSLSCNPLVSLPPELSDLKHLVIVELHGTYTTLLSPPHTIVRNGVAAILSFLEAQRTQKTTEFRCTSIVSTPSIVESRRNVAQRAPISEEKYQADLERREVLLLRVQKRRLELDRIILQRQIASLLVERNAMAERLLAMEEGPKTCCVVCMDLPRSQLCLPCRHLCLCENCIVPLKICPLCREMIEDKLQVFM